VNEQYAQLAELAGGFIHEIKNHLSTLGLNLQLLAEDFQEPETPRERRALDRVQRLQNECQRLINVSNDFLRFARIEQLDTAPAKLADVIEEMVDFFGPTARQANIEINCYLPATLPPVALDRERFKQALLNLLLNAEQAMPGGGELTIQAGLIADCGLPIADSHRARRGSPDPAETADRQVSLDAPEGDLRSAVSAGSGDPRRAPADSHLQSAIRNPQSEQSAIELSLIDTGKGMSDEVLERVWRPFYSTKVGGTGLGLPTTKKIIEAHGGTIDVQSAVGKGTKFTIRLPVLPEAAALTCTTAAAAEA
jgi:signal transduction histidine kinase